MKPLWIVAAWIGQSLLLISLVAKPAAAEEIGYLRVAGQSLTLTEESTAFTARIDMALGKAVEAALHNGVPLTLVWQLQLVDREDLAPDQRLWSTDGRLRLSYRSLSRHYSLNDVNRDRETSYPRLEAMLADIQRLDLEFPPLDPVVAGKDDVVLRFRIRLDIGALPPPLRLPGYLSREWRLDSGWAEEPLR